MTPTATRSEVLRESELAPGNDVLLYLRRAAPDGVDHGVAVRRLGAAGQRGFFGLDPQLRTGSRDVHGGVGQALGELGGEELVLGGLGRRRRAALGGFEDELEPHDPR